MTGLFTQTCTCQGCGHVGPHLEGPTHDYILSSSDCWRIYSEVLSRQYVDPGYRKALRLTVDTYAIQHPGEKEEFRAVQSINVHLVSLYLILEKGLTHYFSRHAIAKIIRQHKHNFTWLEPPAQIGELKIADISRAVDATHHCELVSTWANSAWQAWEKHHGRIAELVDAAKIFT